MPQTSHAYSIISTDRPRPVARRLWALGFVGLALATGARLAPVRLAVVSGDSMAPRLRDGQLLVCEKGLHSQPVARGEIVLAKVNGSVCVKRVYAVGGDRLWQAEFGPRDGVPPRLLPPNASIVPWRRRYPTLRFKGAVVPQHSVYLIGEANTSHDSRNWGPVPENCVLGRVVLPAPAAGDNWMESVALTMPTRRPTRISRS